MVVRMVPADVGAAWLCETVLKRLHGAGRGSGTTLDRYRMNEIVSQIAFAGRRGRVYRRLVTLSGVRPGDSVLDVGSSSGYLARKLADATGPAGQVTAVDPSPAAITYARRRARPFMTFLVGTAQDLALPDSCFDVVTCTLAVHHILARKRGTAFSEMYRVTQAQRPPAGRRLRPGTATTPHAPGRPADAPRRRHSRPAGRPRNRHRIPGRILRRPASAALHRCQPPRAPGKSLTSNKTLGEMQHYPGQHGRPPPRVPRIGRRLRVPVSAG
jgi:SAM-dependent methyltransferase